MEGNKTALITGAASGIGYELTLLLAKDNYSLVLIDLNEDKLQDLKKELESQYSIRVTTIAQDLSQAESAQLVYEKVKHLKIEVLVNCAGFGLFGAFRNTKWERELAMLNLHIITTTHLTKLVLSNMVKQKSGKILNVCSLAAFQPGPFMSLYYASKAYMLSFSEAIANELKGTGVTVTVLCPGPTKTKFQSVVSNSASENKIKANMACAKEVAAYAYKAMNKGKTVVIPGFLNKFLSVIPRILTRNKVTSIVRNIQLKNRAAEFIEGEMK